MTNNEQRMTKFPALGEFIALDFETTGLLPENDTVIDIGAIRYRDGQEIQRFSTLVNPRRTLSPEIMQLTGITNEELKAAPTLDAVRDEFRAFLGGENSTIPIMAHNADFERRFLEHVFGSDFQAPMMMDTCHLLALMYPLAPSLSLQHFIREFGIRDFEHHRGLQDALDMIAVVQHLDGELAKPEFAGLCAIVEYWFGDNQTGKNAWGWLPFMLTRHEAQLPEYRNFKEMFAEMERSTLDTSLSAAPTKLKQAEFFSRVYERYQLRTAQQQMSEKAVRTLNDGGFYVAEAGTGTGKTLAYLTAALAALSTDADSPIVISTHTKALQNQFLQQELPRLRELFELPDLHAVVLKGMNNYACLRKINEILPEPERLFSTDTDALFAGAFLMRWMDVSEEGEVEELPRPLHEFPIVQRAANEARADFRDCTRSECSFFQQCFYFKKQWEAASAHILAVNHSLLLTYPRSYPEFDRLIVDEADELTNEAVEAFSNIALRSQMRDTIAALTADDGILSDSYSTVQLLLRDVKNSKKAENATATLPNLTHVWGLGTKFNDILARLTVQMQELRGEDNFTLQAPLNDQRINTDQRRFITDDLENLRVVAFEILQTADKLLKLWGGIDSVEPTAQQKELLYRVEDLQKIVMTITQFLEQEEKKFALYLRVERNDWAVVATPYNIGTLFAEKILTNLYAAVFTSATISSTRDMQDFIKGLGLNSFQNEESDNHKPLSTSRFKSPFDYRKNSRIIFLKGFPANNQPTFAKQSAEFIAKAAAKLGGRTLVLFTSKARLQQVHTALFPMLQKQNIELISHGITSPSQHKCVEQFKFSDSAVLMGARGLWKGVDIPGDDLQCIVLEKMPYAVPNPYTRGLQEALVAQYADEALERGEQPDPKRLSQIAWNEVDKPLMFQAFRQMFGRLIRTDEDQGVMYVLDSQLQSGSLSPRHKQLLELMPDVPYGLAYADDALEELGFLL